MGARIKDKGKKRPTSVDNKELKERTPTATEHI